MTVTTDDTLPDPGAQQSPAGVDGTPSPLDGAVPLVEEDLLVEDVSIDGMCGVY